MKMGCCLLASKTNREGPAWEMMISLIISAPSGRLYPVRQNGFRDR